MLKILLLFLLAELDFQLVLLIFRNFSGHPCLFIGRLFYYNCKNNSLSILIPDGNPLKKRKLTRNLSSKKTQQQQQQQQQQQSKQQLLQSDGGEPKANNLPISGFEVGIPINFIILILLF